MNTWDYVDAGYVDDGYIFTARPVILQLGTERVALRAPSSRSGSIRLLQAEEVSTGWARYGSPPITAVHTLLLEYPQMRADEYAPLAAFREAVDDIATEFEFIDGLTGATATVWFAEPDFEVEEAGFNLYKHSLTLQSHSTFIPYPSSPPANLAAVLEHVHYPYRVTITRKQPHAWLSDGTRRVANKSALRRHIHTVSLVRKSAEDLGKLLSYFEHVAVGIRNKWSWTLDGTARQVRFPEAKLDWRQSRVQRNMYDIDLTLEEDA